MKLIPSNDPVVEKAQHEPHWPWFLIGVTAPAVTQSTEAGKASASTDSDDSTSVASIVSFNETNKHPIFSLNSYWAKSAYWFKPTVDVCSDSEFHFWMKS